MIIPQTVKITTLKPQKMMSKCDFLGNLFFYEIAVLQVVSSTGGEKIQISSPHACFSLPAYLYWCAEKYRASLSPNPVLVSTTAKCHIGLTVPLEICNLCVTKHS